MIVGRKFRYLPPITQRNDTRDQRNDTRSGGRTGPARGGANPSGPARRVPPSPSPGTDRVLVTGPAHDRSDADRAAVTGGSASVVRVSAAFPRSSVEHAPRERAASRRAQCAGGAERA